MKIVILTSGSRGDTQPYVALGKQLMRAGCQVRLATFGNFEQLVRDAGLEFYKVRGDIAQVAASADTRHAVNADNPLKLLLSFNKLKDKVFDLQQDFYKACEGADAIVYHPGAIIGHFIAQKQGIPGILATPFPMTETRAYPALIFYDGPFRGGSFNTISHRIFASIMWLASGKPVAEFWKKQFGTLPENFVNPFMRRKNRSYPTIVACSPEVFAKSSDWPDEVQMSGYWFLDETVSPDDFTELRQFIAAGKPPVYVGFGSIGDPTLAKQTTQIVVEALQLAGQRGVLATGWSGMSNELHVPADMFVVDSVPHAWLFPQMAAIVHHGGAGTTAAGLRAGIPTVIIPHSNDQFAWGRRIFELGVGARAIKRKKLNAQGLAMAITSALQPEVKFAAAAMGERIRGEQGLIDSVATIMQLLSKK